MIVEYEYQEGKSQEMRPGTPSHIFLIYNKPKYNSLLSKSPLIISKFNSYLIYVDTALAEIRNLGFFLIFFLGFPSGKDGLYDGNRKFQGSFQNTQHPGAHGPRRQGYYIGIF